MVYSLRAQKVDRQVLYMDTDDQETLLRDLAQKNEQNHQFFGLVLRVVTLIELITLSILHILGKGVAHYPWILVSLLVTMVGNTKGMICNAIVLVRLLVDLQWTAALVAINGLCQYIRARDTEHVRGLLADLDHKKYKFKTV